MNNLAKLSTVAELMGRTVNLQSANLQVASADVSFKKESLAKATDRRLVECAKNGSLEAFQVLVQRHQSKAFSVALSIIGNRMDAEDIVQESFLKAYKNLSLFQGNSAFYTWLYRIVSNLSIDYSRKRYRTAEVLASDMVAKDEDSVSVFDNQVPVFGDDVITPEKNMEQVQMRNSIGKAFESLSPEHRSVIFLREVEGLSYIEISEAVGCSKGTVMSRLHHARKKLQEALLMVGLGSCEYRVPNKLRNCYGTSGERV